MSKRRNWIAVSARLRSGAGKHQDRRVPKGGAHNEFQEYLEEYQQYLEDCEDDLGLEGSNG